MLIRLQPKVSTVPLKNSSLKKIVNVYQQKYANGLPAGLGDYLRGSLCMLQIARMNNMQFDMNFENHPISKFLVSSTPAFVGSREINYAAVSKYIDSGSKNHITFYNNFINMLNKQTGDHYYTLCNSIPIAVVNPLHRRIIREKLLPNDILTRALEDNLKLLQLQKKQYSVIHIRTGDRFLLNNNKLDSYVIQTINYAIKSKINAHNKYLILSDCNELKKYLKQHYPMFVVNINNISHLGETAKPSDDATKNTLVDFFMMAYSNMIISLSPYGHGSGFSKWCAEIYGIKCVCEKIPIPI